MPKLTSAQQKIYEDKYGLSDAELQFFIDHEVDYLYDVVFVSKLILAERSGMQDEAGSEVTQAFPANPAWVRSDGLRVDGPPFEKGFKSSSIMVIVLSAIIRILVQLIPKDDIGILAIFLFLLLLVSIWATVISSTYLKRIHRNTGFAVLCFFTPFVGLLVVRYLGFQIDDPEARELYTRAKNYYTHQLKGLRMKAGGSMDIKAMEQDLALRLNASVNHRVTEYYSWLQLAGDVPPTMAERQSQLDALSKEYWFEEDALPILDTTFRTNAPPDGQEFEKLSTCPACGHSISPDHTQCPECGISLA